MTDMESSHGAPWYRDGLRFECTQCGNCCTNHGEHSSVNLTHVELAEIPAFLGLSREEFLARYCVQRPGVFPTLRADQAECPFLGADRRCRIYAVRPKACRTWPFWKHNLVRENWDGPVRACCSGIGTGPLHSAEEIDRQAR